MRTRFALVFLLLACAPVAQAASLLAGVARADITPPVGYAMAGYGARKGVSTGVHDRLTATVLLLKSEKQALAIVALDLAGFASSRVESEIAKRFGITGVLLASSHTHSGPDPVIRADSPAAMKEWFTQTEDKIIQAAGEANAKLAPARLAAGTGSVLIGHNRRRVLPNGKVEMFWRNAERIPTSPVDPTVTVLRVENENGSPRAVLVNYSTHPTVLGPDNLQLSADYVGAMRAYVEKQFPGATCLFAQGATGNINPYLDKQPINQQPFEAVRETGETLGAEVVRTAQRLSAKPAAAPLVFESRVHEFVHRWEKNARVAFAMGAGLLDQDLCLITISADPFVEHQMRLRQEAACSATFFFAHTSTRGHVYGRYLPTIKGAMEGGYGGDRGTNMAEAGAGEILITRAVVRLLELRGKLDPPAGSAP